MASPSFIGLKLSKGWVLINTEKIRTVEYFQKTEDTYHKSFYYPPDKQCDNLPSDVTVQKLVKITFDGINHDDDYGTGDNPMSITVQDDTLFQAICKNIPTVWLGEG